MKLNKYFAFAAMAVTALFTASCSDDDNEVAPGKWDANEDYANVYLETTSLTETLEPTAATTSTFELFRRNTSGAVTASFKVLKNTDDVFTVGNAVFADGDSVATVTISFPNAEIGKAYTLQVTLDDPQLVSSYSSSIVYTYNVLRAKWNLLGTGVLSDKFWFEDSWEVEIYQRDDDNSYYRIKDPFAAWADDLDGTQSDVWDFHVLKAGDMIGDVEMEDAGIIDWTDVNTGYYYDTYESHVHYAHPQTRASDSYHTYDLYKNNSVLDYLPDGKTPGKIQMAPIFMMHEYGAGYNYADDPQITITFPGYVEEYTATPEDFDWVEVFTGDFNSAQLGTKTSGITLYKGVTIDSVETANPGCYERFAAVNGDVYKIEAPYTDGNDIYFCVRDGKVGIPEGYESQSLGFKAVGVDVYGKITAGESSYTEGIKVELSITFQNEAGNIEYGTATEVLELITWTAAGTGTYTYTVKDYTGQYGGVWEGTVAATIYACDQDETRFKIAPWADQTGEDGLIFTMDEEGSIVVDNVETGRVDKDYGMIYASDLITYGAAEVPSYFEEGVYYFALAYYDVEGAWAYVQDTFTMDSEAPASESRIFSGFSNTKNLKKRPNMSRINGFKNVKNSRQARINAHFNTPRKAKKAKDTAKLSF